MLPDFGLGELTPYKKYPAPRDQWPALVDLVNDKIDRFNEADLAGDFATAATFDVMVIARRGWRRQEVWANIPGTEVVLRVATAGYAPWRSTGSLLTPMARNRLSLGQVRAIKFVREPRGRLQSEVQ